MADPPKKSAMPPARIGLVVLLGGLTVFVALGALLN
jgi:hypothetical protein